MGREIGMHRDYSEETAREIDEEVKKLVESAESLAEDIIRKDLKKLKKLAEMLLEKEILAGDEIDKILGIKKSKRKVKNIENDKSK